MVVTCPACDKKLKVPEEARGKKVRCPGCKAPIAVPALWIGESPPSREEADPKGRGGPRCATCGAPGLRVLPRNLFTRRPGYECTACTAKMRPPGSSGTYLLATVLASFVIVFGIVGLVIGVFANQDLQIEGGLTLMILGVTVIGWALYQWRLPLPLDAPPAPSRLGCWLAIVGGLLLLGAAIFGFYYYLHEML